jgi:hypothetical protein
MDSAYLEFRHEGIDLIGGKKYLKFEEKNKNKNEFYILYSNFFFFFEF